MVLINSTFERALSKPSSVLGGMGEGLYAHKAVRDSPNNENVEYKGRLHMFVNQMVFYSYNKDHFGNHLVGNS